MKLIAKIEGMHCNGCRLTLENELNNSKIVKNVSVNLENKTASIEVFDNTKLKDIEKIIKKTGFKCIQINEEK